MTLPSANTAWCALAIREAHSACRVLHRSPAGDWWLLYSPAGGDSEAAGLQGSYMESGVGPTAFEGSTHHPCFCKGGSITLAGLQLFAADQVQPVVVLLAARRLQFPESLLHLLAGCRAASWLLIALLITQSMVNLPA